MKKVEDSNRQKHKLKKTQDGNNRKGLLDVCEHLSKFNFQEAEEKEEHHQIERVREEGREPLRECNG